MSSELMRFGSQVIDVFNVAPLDGHRSLTVEQAKAVLVRNGVEISTMSDSKIVAFARQTPAGRVRAIEAYQGNGQRAQQFSKNNVEGTASNAAKSASAQENTAQKDNWSPNDDELVYKTIKRYKRDPVSIELGCNESKAAKAAIVG